MQQDGLLLEPAILGPVVISRIPVVIGPTPGDRLLTPAIAASATGHFYPDDVAKERSPSRKLRLVLYSHDTMGMGHMRRNALIAEALASHQAPLSILLIAGAHQACHLSLPEGADLVALPALYKDSGGEYRPRSLGLSLAELIDLRSRNILATVQAFRPDVLIVDKVPRGALRELESSLNWLRAREHTRCILGLRDILDEPSAVRREWTDGTFEDAVREYYDAVWIYGDRQVYDQIREYEFPADIVAKVAYTGYLTRPLRTSISESEAVELSRIGVLSHDRLVLCMVGGGQDGSQLAEAFADVEFPAGTKGVVVTGPYMPTVVQERLRQRAAVNPNLRVLKFVNDPDLLLCRAECVVTMAGYNAVCEALAFQKRVLLVPRVTPRQEQFIRAERLQQLGLVDFIHPGELSPQRITTWLQQSREISSRNYQRVNLQGALKLPRLLKDVVMGASRAGLPH